MEIRLVAGLGNPGARYAGTPHNVGFDLVEYLAGQWGCRLRRSWRWRALTCKTVYAGRPVWMAQPLSFMNNSGAVVRDIMRAAGIAPGNLIVALDDVALPMGQIRVRVGGGDAGHRGLRSVRECLGSDDFVRIRMGVGPAERPASLAEYVLKKLPATMRPVAARMVELAGAAVCRVLDAGAESAMNEYNGRKL